MIEKPDADSPWRGAEGPRDVIPLLGTPGEHPGSVKAHSLSPAVGTLCRAQDSFIEM